MIEKVEMYRSAICEDLKNSFGLNSNVASIIFSGYLNQIRVNNQITNRYPLEKFKKRFNITSNILEPMKEIWAKNPGTILAGGKMIDFFMNRNMSESTNDYDLFYISTLPYHKANGYLMDLGYSQTVLLGYLTEYVKETDNGVVHIQSVASLFGCPEAVIESFDIRACAIACDGEFVYWGKGALHDARDKRIVMYNPRNDTKIFNRIHKYLEKGYKISKPDLAIASVCLLDGIKEIRKTDELEEMYYRDVESFRNAREAYRPADEIATIDDPGYV